MSFQRPVWMPYDSKHEVEQVELSLEFHLLDMFPDYLVVHEEPHVWRICMGARFVQINVRPDEAITLDEDGYEVTP